MFYLLIKFYLSLLLKKYYFSPGEETGAGEGEGLEDLEDRGKGLSGWEDGSETKA